MLEKKTIARPYAQAAFEQASEENDLTGWSEALSILAMITSDEQMKKLMHDPRVSNDQIQAMVTELAGDILTNTKTNFVKILVESDRLMLCPEISQIFDEKKADAQKHASIQVVSAYEMDESEKQKIAEAMKKKLGRSVEVTSEQDPGLIGGMVVKSGDMVIDLSIRGRLNKMANEFN